MEKEFHRIEHPRMRRYCQILETNSVQKVQELLADTGKYWEVYGLYELPDGGIQFLMGLPREEPKS